MASRRWIPLALALASATSLSVALGACDGDTSPVPVDGPAGGGVGGGTLGDTLDVRVVDARARTPVGGASVTAGLDGATVATATTDASGRARLQAAAIGGVVDVQVHAAGYAATTWIGVRGRAVTIPLSASATPGPTMVAVTVNGIAAITSPGPTMGSVEVYVEASGPRPVSGLPPELEPPVCAMTLGSDRCTAAVPAQDGTRAVVATVVVVDTHGTADPADDTHTVAGFAVTHGVVVAPSAAVTLDARSTAEAFDLRFDDAPPGLAGVVGVPGLASASEGVAFFSNDASPARTMLAAPVDATGGGDATFWVMAVASAPAGDSQSVIIRRQLTDTGAPVALGAWLEPAVVAVSATSVPPILTFDAVSGAALYALDGRDPAGALVATGFVLGGGTGHLTAHMPAGAADTRWTVRAIDATASATDTDLDRVDHEAARVSLTAP